MSESSHSVGEMTMRSVRMAYGADPNLKVVLDDCSFTVAKGKLNVKTGIATVKLVCEPATMVPIAICEFVPPPLIVEALAPPTATGFVKAKEG